MSFTKAGLLAFAAIGLYGTIALGAASKMPSMQEFGDTTKAIGLLLSFITPILLALFASFSSSEVEKLKARLSTGIEAKKAVINGRIQAFDALLAAAYFSYFAIYKQILHSTEGDAEIRKDADKRASEASRLLWYLDEDYRDLWFEVYQRSSELLEEIGEQPVEKRHELFGERLFALGVAIKKLQSGGRVALDEV